MKKVLFAVLATGLMGTSLMAGGVNGKIKSIDARNTGVVRIIVLANDTNEYDRQIIGSEDAKKAMLAVALTAKASTADVFLGQASGGWTSVVIK